MKTTKNKVQSEYITMKALVEALEEREEQMEQAYLASHDIPANPDGSMPERIFCIDDDTAFEKANEEFAAEMAACGLETDLKAAKEALKAAEDALIQYGLSLAPIGTRNTLEKGAETNYTIRQKLIDLVLRLDMSTVQH